MIAPTKAIQDAAQAEVERIQRDARNGKLTREDCTAYTTLLDLAIYPPDIEERIIDMDAPVTRRTFGEYGR